MATCPECDADVDVDEFDVDKGDLISCAECGSNLQVGSIAPLELEPADDDDEDDDDDDDNGGGNGIGTLPTTGSGVSNDPNPWMGALAAGGIVAAAATVLRRNKAETEQRHIS